MKYRITTWWWGRYVTKINGRWVDQDGDHFQSAPPKNLEDQLPGWPQWEEYKEELHGKDCE